jgi:5-methylcytosine-specific restriction endonuclease McrA
MGGRCSECGRDDPGQLQFDHVDPEMKEVDVSDLLNTGIPERIAKEVLKCQLLCVNCHKEKTRAEADARKMARWVEEDQAAGLLDGLFRPLPADALKRPAEEP